MFANYEPEFPIWASRPQCPPPDWRWRRACYLVDQGRHLSSKRDDPLLCRAIQFIRALRGSATEQGLRTLVKNYPDLYLAMQVFQEPSLRPLEIKARILARQTDHGIAWRVGLPVSAVQAYLRLFFDVREYIDARVYIVHRVIGLDPESVPTPEALVLLTAYRHGPGAVEPALDFLEHMEEQHDLTTATGRMRASFQLLLDVWRLQSTEAMQLSLVRRQPFISHLEQKKPNPASVAGAISVIGTQMLAEITWAREPEPLFADPRKPMGAFSTPPQPERRQAAKAG